MHQLSKILSAICLISSVFPCHAETKHSPITGLLTPESVAQAKDGRIYVSEINGFGKDGDGQIRVINQGKTSVLLAGLDDPKGLAIIGDDLYIADKTKVLKVNTKTAMPKAEVFVPASAFVHAPQFLNDLEADAQGNLYITDSGDILGSGKGGAIYKVSPKGEVTLLLDGEKDARILAPNGLLTSADGNTLYLVDFTSGVLYGYQLKTQALAEIAQGFGGGDGIVRDKDDMLYVSDWKSGRVFSVNAKGETSVIKEGYQSAADIVLSYDGKYIMVPDMKAGVVDFIPLK